MKKISWRRIGNRLNGFSIPVVGGGLNWTPSLLDVEVASKLLTYLEDRRVLFNPLDAEIPWHVTDSVLQMRTRLNTDLQAIKADSDLAHCIRGMRASCHKFLNESQKLDVNHNLWQGGNLPAEESLFMDALGQFRGIMGVYIAKLSATYHLDVEGDLITILPPTDMDDPNGIPNRKAARVMELKSLDDEGSNQ